jgi:hypothetical protein
VGWDSNGDVDHYISYSRAGDATTLIQNTQWRIIFEQPFGSSGFDREWVWALPFDSKFNPENPLIRMFSPIGGSYTVRPSQLVTDMWNAETQRPAQGGSIPYDARGILSTKLIGGQPVVMKYLYNYLNFNSLLPVNPLAKTGKWFLFRQTHLHMRFSEAANRSRKHRLAWGLLNSGIAGAFPAPGSDVTNFHNTLNESFPFNFDARNSGSTGVPFYTSTGNLLPFFDIITSSFVSQCDLYRAAIASCTDSMVSVPSGPIIVPSGFISSSVFTSESNAISTSMGGRPFRFFLFLYFTYVIGGSGIQ